MTKQEAIAAHRKMWRWIADETERREEIVREEDYFAEMGLEASNIMNLCFCCQYAEDRQMISNDINKYMCDYCPVLWGTESRAKIFFCQGSEYDDGGLYMAWVEAISKQKSSAAPEWVRKAAALARQIAELPEREDK